MKLLEAVGWERCVLLVIGLVAIYQLFCDPIVGTADNSDYWRVTDQMGIAYHGDPAPTRFKSIVREWEVVPPKPVAYLTSEVLFGDLAVALDKIVSKDGLFDIEVIGVVHLIAYLLAVMVFLSAFRERSIWLRIVVGTAALLIFTDVRIVAYFNSFYCEPAQIIFLVAAIGCALRAAEQRASNRSQWFAAFLVSAVLFVFAKTQDLVFCFPLGVIGFWICPTPRRSTRAAIAAIFVALFVWGMASDAYAVTKNVNVQIALNDEILKHSKQPAADLQELGGGDPAAVTFGSIAMFYAHHPMKWWAVAKRRLHEAFTRTPYGNFEAPVAAESQAFAFFSNWKTEHYSRSIYFWLVAMIGYAVFLLRRWRSGDPAARTSALCNAMWVAGCALQFIAVVTFEANGTEKHFFIFNVLVDLVILLAIAEVDSMLAPRRST